MAGLVTAYWYECISLWSNKKVESLVYDPIVQDVFKKISEIQSKICNSKLIGIRETNDELSMIL